MKNFLTKNEACEMLKKLQNSGEHSEKTSALLASVRVCLAAETMGFDIWGKSVEDARPLFRSCEKPEADASEDMVANYEAYQQCLSEAYNKFVIKE